MDEATKISKFKFSPFKLLLLLAVLLGGIYFAQRSGANPNEYKNDFNVYYFASQEILAGRTPYENSIGEWTPYLYPPLLAELLAPIALLPLPVAAYLWFLINASALFATVQMSATVLKDRSKSADDFALLGRKFSKQMVLSIATFIFFARFILDNFDYGQVNLFVTALAVAHVYFYSKDKKSISALALILAVSIKITPIVFLLYHTVKGRVKFVAACIALMIGLSVLSFAPFATRAPEAFNTFVNRSIKNQQGFNLAYHGNQSLRATVERSKGNQEVTDPASASTAILGFAFLSVACFVAFKAKSEIAAAAPFFCCCVLLSPLSWKQHFVILILPVAFLIMEALPQRKPPTKKLLLSTLFVVFALFNFTSPKIIGVSAAEWCDVHSLVFVGLLLLFFAAVALPLTMARSQA